MNTPSHSKCVSLCITDSISKCIHGKSSDKCKNKDQIGVFARQNIEIITITNDISDVHIVFALRPEHMNAVPFAPLMLRFYFSSLKKNQLCFVKLIFQKRLLLISFHFIQFYCLLKTVDSNNTTVLTVFF